jgi:hypothetical protein
MRGHPVRRGGYAQLAYLMHGSLDSRRFVTWDVSLVSETRAAAKAAAP